MTVPKMTVPKVTVPKVTVPKMRKLVLSVWSSIALVLVAGCDGGEVTPDPPDAFVPADAGSPPVPDPPPPPEPPSILRDVAPIDDEVHFTRPFVPGHRTTMDGRVAVRVQGGPPGTEALQQNFSFFLFVPEQLDAPIMAGPNGPVILADTEPFDVPFPPALEPGVSRLGHHAICDPTLPFPRPGERPNPSLCGPEGTHDCYEITIISSTSTVASTQLWGTPVTVEVAEPKTTRARIVDVTLGEPRPGVVIPTAVEFMEPAVTMDGRLLTGRLGRAPRDWTHPQTGETFNRPYDLVYFQLPDDADPCDITGWTDFHPISHAPHDPRMVGRYGLAAYPFRDTEGNPIPDGEDMGGTYPWVDREGANVFMTGVHGTIAEQSERRFPRRCVVEGCESLRENVDWDRGFMVGGLWTHGKFVVLDGMINNQDWAVGVTPASHWLVDLYRDTEGEPVEVRFGVGRFIDSFRSVGGPYPAGYTHNANILDSLQQLLNHRPEARPITPRDVVWIMSTGVATEEIAFDDLTSPHALILSNMQASITQLYHEDGWSLGVPRHHNGQVREIRNPNFPLLPNYRLDPDADEEIHLQNAATSLDWRVPAYGRVAAGTARVEPVALGGVEGRGFWLSGEAEIVYEVPAQERDVLAHDWYVGLFVDPRASDEVARGLLRFPDGSELRLVGRSSLHFLVAGELVHEVALPASEGWIHFGFQLRDGNQEVTFFLDGMALDRFVHDASVFVPTEGELIVAPPGEDGARLRAWIDDFVVIANRELVEVACNHARGTLIRLDPISEDPASEELAPEWEALADRHPAWAHAEVALAAGAPEGARFACYHDYRADYAAHLGNIPAGAVSVREAIIFPEGPVRAGAPRPDSTGNAFCTSCHSADGRGGLSLAALELRPDLLAEDDPRRQPDQPPRRVFGNIPAGWIAAGAGPGSPAEATQAPPEGLVIDHWVLPATD